MTSHQVQITFHGLESSEPLEALIREKASKLRSIDQHLQRIRVVVDMPHRSHNKGNHLEVKLELFREGEDPIIVSRDNELDAEHDSSFNLVREVFTAATRVIRDHTHRKETERRARS